MMTAKVAKADNQYPNYTRLSRYITKYKKEAPSHIAGYGTGLEEITKPTRPMPDGSRVGRNYFKEPQTGMYSVFSSTERQQEQTLPI